MPLKVSHGIKSWIDDFQQSKDKRFDGKSAEKRREMAIAAYMAAKREQKENVKTADKKPEMYTKPDGKRGTRMVPVDREVVKQEKNLEWLKAALEAQARKTKPRQDDMEENVQELTIADVQKATAMAKKRQEKEREAGKKSVSTTDLAARLPKKEDSDDFTVGRARNKKQFTHASIDHKGNMVGFGRKPGGTSHAAVGKDGIAHGFANSHSDAKDLARTRNKRRPGSSRVVKLKHVELKKPLSYAQADKHLGKSLKGHYHEATIPDGQTAMTKKPKISKKDKETVGKIQALMKRANEDVNEISIDKLSRYGSAAAKDVQRQRDKVKGALDQPLSTKHQKAGMAAMKKLTKRSRGSDMYVDKMTGRSKVKPSSATSGKDKSVSVENYAQKSADRHKMLMKQARSDMKNAKSHSDMIKHMNKYQSAKKAHDRATRAQFDENKGIEYMKKMGNAKADAEAGEMKKKKVDEISNAKMGQYVRKAADDAARKASKGDVVGARQRVKGVNKAMDKIDKNRLFGRSG